MAKKTYQCFVICPLGDVKSATRKTADHLKKLVIVPAANSFKNVDIVVKRGDELNDTGRIDSDVVRAVRGADFCIVDISEPNPNVYYEFGMRQGLGGDAARADIILLKRKGLSPPVDLGTMRYIEYDLTDLDSLALSQSSLEEKIKEFIDTVSSVGGTGDEDRLERIERAIMKISQKVDRAIGGLYGVDAKSTYSNESVSISAGDGSMGSLSEVSASDKLRLALRQRNIPLAESAMHALQHSMDKLRFYDIVVEQVAGLGSTEAGEMLESFAEEFMESEMSLVKKVEYIGYLVTRYGNTDREEEGIPKVDGFAKQLLAHKDITDEVKAQIYNQLNRINAGCAATLKGRGRVAEALQYYENACGYIKQALDVAQLDYLYGNLASCYREMSLLVEDEELKSEYLLVARDAIDAYIRISDDLDDDYVELACKIYRDLGAPGLDEMVDKLRGLNPIKAELFVTSKK